MGEEAGVLGASIGFHWLPLASTGWRGRCGRVERNWQPVLGAGPRWWELCPASPSLGAYVRTYSSNWLCARCPPPVSQSATVPTQRSARYRCAPTAGASGRSGGSSGGGGTESRLISLERKASSLINRGLSRDCARDPPLHAALGPISNLCLGTSSLPLLPALEAQHWRHSTGGTAAHGAFATIMAYGMLPVSLERLSSTTQCYTVLH